MEILLIIGVLLAGLVVFDQQRIKNEIARRKTLREDKGPDGEALFIWEDAKGRQHSATHHPGYAVGWFGSSAAGAAFYNANSGSGAGGSDVGGFGGGDGGGGSV